MKTRQEKAIRRRWRKVGRGALGHDDGSKLHGHPEGWYLVLPDKAIHGPFKYADDERTYHAKHRR